MHRATFPEVPPRVEYALTEKGLALVPIIDSMRTYGAEWLGAEAPSEGRTSPPPHPDHPTLSRRVTVAAGAAA